MNIAIRVDASNQIGTGHFMRCLTLADELRQRDAHIRFVSRDLPVHLRDMLTTKGMEFAALDSDVGVLTTDELAHAHWLGASQAQDAEACIQVLSDQAWDWLIVDHYALDTRWESALRGTAKRIMVIDDIADRKHDCDILLDQNFYSDMQTRYADKVPAHCQLLLGPRYVLLRQEFADVVPRERNGEVRRILLFFGGVDAANYTGRAINVLAEIGVEGVCVDVVIGAQHPNRVEIEAQCAAQGFVCHLQTNRMAELMTAADLVLGAGGSSLWERAVLGVPSMVAITAANQVDTTIATAGMGACHLLNDIDGATLEGWARALRQLLGDPGQLQQMSAQCMRLVQDANGCKRVSQCLLPERRLAIVTGHTRGLGAALMQRLLLHGVHVLGIARGQTTEAGGLTQISADFDSPDLSWLSAVEINLQNLLEKHDNVYFFNNAAMIQPIELSHQLSAADIDCSYRVNVRAPMLLAGRLAHYCLSNGHELTIVNISSGAAHKPIVGWGLYCSQKAAIKQAFDVIELEYDGLTVHHIDPGVMDTGMQNDIRAASGALPTLEYFVRLWDEGRLQQPGVVAEQILSAVLVK